MSQPASTRKWSVRDLVVQAVFLAVVVLLVVSAISSARTNLQTMGLTSGFDFLDRATGWSYSFALVSTSIDDPYRWTLFVGFLNTLFLGLLSIVIATVLGFIVGTARDARNIALQGATTIVVQVFRNIPLILQVVFWYAVLIHLPGPRQAHSIYDVAFLSSRGFYLPTLNMPGWVALPFCLFAIGVAALLVGVHGWSALRKVGVWLLVMCLGVAVSLLWFAPTGEPYISVPSLKGLRFRGGLELAVEFVAMLIAIVLYGSAYIAEVVKGGLRAVPKGLVEAGRSLGLSEFAIWWKIKMPMALRSIIPPLGNQWIFLMKATTVGVAIGFSDLFYIVSTSITQSGQTLELIFILMAAFLLINFMLAQFINLLNARMQLKTSGG